MKYWVDGCTGRKRQERRQLTISHFRGAAFCFLMFLLFFVFLLFIGYGIWGVVFDGMLAPISNASGGTLLLEFILFGDACLLMGEKKALGEGRK
jgi:hypothetical protein